MLTIQKDIILTTLKPQLKNVTASDVASSLYYFHLNSEEDARIIEEEQNSKSDVESTLTGQKSVTRKALPDSARSSLDIKRQSATPLVRLDSNSSVTKRKPVPASEALPKLSDPLPSKPPLSRRPLGPRPQYSDTTFERKPLPDHLIQSSASNQTSYYRNASPARHENNTNQPYLQPVNTQTHHPDTKSSPAFTITVIRRDPSSASQWNVGTVTGIPTSSDANRHSTSPQRNKRPYFDLNVHLTNPGYGSFKNSYLSSQMENLKLSPTSPLKSAGLDNNSSKSIRPNYGFSRDVRMEGADFWKRSMPQHKRSRSDMAVKQGITRGRSFSGSEVVESVKTQQSSEMSNTSKGYAFISPWNGRCKFMTSSSGRSLRCKHTLPDPVSAHTGEEDDQHAKSSIIVSEIRFNLPSAAIFNSVSESFAKIGEGGNQRFSIPAFDHLRSKFSLQKSPPQYPPRPSRDSHSGYSREDEETPPLPPRPIPLSSNHTDSSEDEVSYHHRGTHEGPSMDRRHNDGDDDRFDLSLGQEKAGGGNRGKRAKLGKLIIHDEGFKFLDLLVAANIGVWWSVWEPDF